MSSSPSVRVRAVPVAAAAVAIAIVAGIALVASGVLGRGAEPSSSPSTPPVVSPSPQPSSEPSPVPSPVPSSLPSTDPGDEPADDHAVDLDTLPGHDVSVVIDDQVGTLVGAASGKPGDGMSVRWFDAIVKDLDAQTIEVTWVGLPVDEELSLLISEYEGGYRLHFGQSNPPLYSDAVGFDRALVLEFDEPVSPDDVVVTFQGGPEDEG
jgi:hypothetical protein